MYKLIVLLIAAIYLYYDYNTDKGQHFKAKIFHASVIVVILYQYLSSIKYSIWMLANPSKVWDKMAIRIGVFPPEITICFSIVNVLVGLGLLYCAVMMIKRKESGRVWLIRLLPIAALPEVFSFYRGWMESSDNSPYEDLYGIAWGVTIMGWICFGVFKLYRSKFMLAFYERSTSELKLLDNSDI